MSSLDDSGDLGRSSGSVSFVLSYVGMFKEVTEEFERNFTERGDVVAAFAAWRGDEPLVDLVGGAPDEPLFVIFSGTKGVVAAAMLMLRERGQLDFDAPVCRYWPEFGKDDLRVRDVLAHKARLPGVEREMTFDEFTDNRLVARELERQTRSSDPRTELVYHAFTYGTMCGELMRRIDGRTIGRFIADEISGPLDLELWLGLPEEQEPRVTRLELASSFDDSEGEDPLERSIWDNPPTFSRERFAWNSRAYHAAEIPGASGIASARSMARFYAGLEQLLSPESLALARTTFSSGIDGVSGTSKHFGPGFQLQTERMTLGPVADAFGHGGAGGSEHGRWPESGIGFSYCMSLMRDDDIDPRPAALLAALHRAVTR